MEPGGYGLTVVMSIAVVAGIAPGLALGAGEPMVPVPPGLAAGAVPDAAGVDARADAVGVGLAALTAALRVRRA